MTKLEYMEQVLRRLLWIYDGDHIVDIEHGRRFGGYSEEQWLAIVLQHARKALDLQDGIDSTELPKAKNGLVVKFLDSAQKKTIELPYAHYMLTGDYPLNGIQLLELNISSKIVSQIEYKSGLSISSLDGKNAYELDKLIENAFGYMLDRMDVEEVTQYLCWLRAMGHLRPDAIVRVEKLEECK